MFQHTNLLDSILKSGLSHTCIHIQFHQKIFLLILSDIPKSYSVKHGYYYVLHNVEPVTQYNSNI